MLRFRILVDGSRAEATCQHTSNMQRCPEIVVTLIYIHFTTVQHLVHHSHILPADSIDKSEQTRVNSQRHALSTRTLVACQEVIQRTAEPRKQKAAESLT